MQSPAHYRRPLPIPPHSSEFAVPALNLKLWAEDSLLSPLFVAFAACFPSKSFIYRFYAESLAKPFIYRIYANTPGVWGISAPTLRSLRLCVIISPRFHRPFRTLPPSKFQPSAVSNHPLSAIYCLPSVRRQA